MEDPSILKTISEVDDERTPSYNQEKYEETRLLHLIGVLT
jgi:hypothetical protein